MKGTHRADPCAVSQRHEPPRLISSGGSPGGCQRTSYTIAALVAFVACASAPPPHALPPPTDVESLIGPAPPLPPIPDTLADGKDRPVNDGVCKGLPAGIWVSERRFAERVVATAERNRLRSEVDAYKRLRGVEREAFLDLQQAYRQDLGASDRRVEARLWIGIAIGAGLVLASSWAVANVGH